MVLDSKRSTVDFALTPVARWFVRRNIQPNTVSWMGLVLAFVSGFLLYLSPENEWLLLLGAFVVILSGYFDALDGKVARIGREGREGDFAKESRMGDYLDHVFDRYADMFMIGGVAVSAWCNPYLGLLALVGVLLTSYMGTQAQAVGAPRLYAGLLGRADRVVLNTLFPIIQFVGVLVGFPAIEVGDFSISWMEIMILYFAIIGNITAIQRGIITWNGMKKQG